MIKNVNEIEMSTEVKALFFILGACAWITINGLFAELSFIVDDLPEGWKLGSYLVIVTQVGNIGPLTTGLLLSKGWISLPTATYLTLSVGVCAMCVLGFHWNGTSSFLGEEHSVILLAMSTLAAMSDCTSNILYWPYAGAVYGADGVLWLGIGEASSLLICSAISWIQSLTAKFTPNIYFFVLAFFMLCGVLSYCRLRSIEVSLRQQRKASGYERLELEPAIEQANLQAVDTAQEARVSILSNSVAAPRHIWMYWTVFAVSFLQNGMLPSVSAYVAEPYGSMVYHLTNTLSAFLRPLMVAVNQKTTSFLSCSNITMGVLSVLWLVASLLSEKLPGSHTWWGGTVVVTISVLISLAIVYSKIAAVVIIQREHWKTEEERADKLRFAGVIMQAGSLCGSVIFFCLVNYTVLYS